MILIYTDRITERLEFTFKFVFEAHDVPYRLTNDPVYFVQEDFLPKMVYSHFPFDKNFPTIHPAELLFEENIQNHQLTKVNWNDIHCLKFDQQNEDPFASIFYVLSRYEEYLDFKPDSHERFTASESILKKMGWLNQPICDIWSESILKWLNSFYSTVNMPKQQAELLITFDIDNTYAYKYKSAIQQIGGRVKDFIKGNHQRMDERRRVTVDGEKDPFDTFDSIEEYLNQGIDVQMFWLLGDLKKYDRNVPWSHPIHQRLIRNLSRQFPIGIHPSYFSNLMPEKVDEERGRLEHIIGEPVYSSRQHFLKVKFPFTYQYLAKIGMKTDYSMGFSDDVGFRLGTARRVRFYDLSNELHTDLELQPFVYMDGTLNQYLGYTPEESKKVIEEMVAQVVRYGGTFCCIWHNDTIGESGIWKNWKQVLDYTISYFNKVSNS